MKEIGYPKQTYDYQSIRRRGPGQPWVYYVDTIMR